MLDNECCTIIELMDNFCIQCQSEVDLSIDNFTLYQAEKGNHYLYCESCKSPYKPIPNPHIEPEIKKVLDMHYIALSMAIGLSIGWLLWAM